MKAPASNSFVANISLHDIDLSRLGVFLTSLISFQRSDLDEITAYQ